MPKSKKKYGVPEKALCKADLQEFANLSENINKELKAKDYQSWSRKLPNTKKGILTKNGRISLDTQVRCFGSWEKALEIINRSAHKPARRSDKDLIDYYKKVWEWNTGGTFDIELTPTPAVFDAYKVEHNDTTSISRHYYEVRWGTWSNFKSLMCRYQENQITLEEFIKAKDIKQIDAPVSKKNRYRVLKRDGFRCVLCGKGQPEQGELDIWSVQLHVDHIQHRSKGGSSTDLENLRTLCSECNVGRGVDE